MTPLNDVVIIKRDNATETSSGIQLLDSHKDPAGTETGKVVAVNGSYISEHGNRHYTDVVEGQRVLFLRKHAVVVKGSKELVTVRYGNLLAVLESEE